MGGSQGLNIEILRDERRTGREQQAVNEKANAAMGRQEAQPCMVVDSQKKQGGLLLKDLCELSRA